MKPKIVFSEYYRHYLNAHKKPWTKLLHFAGQILTLIYIYYIIKWSVSIHWAFWGYMWFAQNVVYLTAWPSHWWIEKNEPLGYTNKYYAKISDIKMLYQVITGKVPLDTRNINY